MNKFNLTFKQALIIETTDVSIYEDFGLCDNEEFSITKEYGTDGLKECLFDKYNDEEENEDLYGEEYSNKLAEILPKGYIELLNLIEEKLKTYEEVQIRLKKART